MNDFQRLETRTALMSNAINAPLADVARPDWLLLEDGPLLAVNKPVDLLTEGVPAGLPTMVGLVKQYLKVKYEKEGNVYLGIPHRLDRASSGVLVMTRNSKAAARVAEQFEKREVTKIYWALLEKTPEQSEAELVDWLRKIPEEARTEVVASGSSPEAKEARLRYRVIGPQAFGTLVEIELLTGRMHQIRAQFASRGCPVVGDTKYGAKPWLVGEPVADAREDVRIALHAQSLTLKHPIRYDELRIEAPVPAFWELVDPAT